MNREEIFTQIANGQLEKTAALSLMRGDQGTAQVSRPEVSAGRMDTADIDTKTPLADRILEYLVERLAAALEVRASEIDVEVNLMELGLDSTNLIQLSEQFERELDITLYPTVFFEYQTLEAVAQYFADQYADAFEEFDSLQLKGVNRQREESDAAAPASENSAPSEGIEIPQLEIADRSHEVAETEPVTSGVSGAEHPSEPLIDRLQAYLIARLAATLDVPDSEIDVEANLMDLGLDSTNLIQLSEQFERELDITLYPTVFFEYQTLEAVAQYFVDEHGDAFVRAMPAPQTTESNALAPTDSASVVTDPVESAPDDVHFYAYRWLETSLEADNTGADGQGEVVLLTASETDAARMRDALRGRKVLLLGPGSAEHLKDNWSRPRNADDTAILSWLLDGSSGAAPHRVAIFISRAKDAIGPDEVSSRGAVYAALDLLRDEACPKELELEFIVDSGDGSEAIHAALAAFAGTVRAEYPKVSTRVVLIGESSKPDEVVADLLECPLTGAVVLRSGSNGDWEERVIEEQTVTRAAAGIVPRKGGVYLISGGAGGLGMLFALHLASQYQAKLVLTGRREEDATILDLLQRLKDAGGEARYVSGDIAEREAVRHVVATALSEFGSINGVIHGAGVLKDSVIASKRRSEFAAVAEPKVRGMLHLDELTAEEPMDFFVSFSSLAAVTGNHGQCDYAYANGFLDGYADYRAGLVRSGMRAGISLSLQWTLWADGGMHPQAASVDYMRNRLGLEPLATPKGLAAFEIALRLAKQQTVVIEGDRLRIAEWLKPMVDRQSPTPGPQVEASKPRVTAASVEPSSPQPVLGAPHSTTGDIALIGFSGEFPGSPTPEAFWENLVEGRDLIGTDTERWNWDGLADLLGIDENSRENFIGGFIESADVFDAEFFRVSAAEAQMMDPQQRRFLQVAWAAIEDAGYDPLSLRGSRTGVFVGASTRDYQDRAVMLGSLLGGMADTLTPQTSTGMALNNIPNRLSYFLDLKGPSEAVDTACSSSLVALHRAVSALRSGDCEQAVVGGVNLLLSPAPFWAFARTGILSADSRCRSFAEGAKGYVRGEGVGAVLLKFRDAAERDGDAIRALIKGSAVNHGGHVQSLTAPNPSQQADVIGQAFDRAGVPAASIGYVEAHGTGTALGDPVEIRGLRRGFEAAGTNTLDAGSCGIGSVKSNIGHLEAAAGIAGLIKVLLCMRHGQLPKSLHIHKPNPYLDLEGSPFYLLREHTPWARRYDDEGNALPYRAGVSSFGFGGTNAHVILEEYPHRALGKSASGDPVLIVLSARNRECLRNYADRLGKYLELAVQREQIPTMDDVAYTLQVGRPRLSEKLGLIVDNIHQAVETLTAFADGAEPAEVMVSSSTSSPELGEALAQPYGAQFLRQLREDGRLVAIAQLWLSGVSVDWEALNEGGSRIPLPTYPFNGDRHWLPSADIRSSRVPVATGHAIADEKAQTVSEPRSEAEPSDVFVDASSTDEPTIEPLKQVIEADLTRYLVQTLADLLKMDSNDVDLDRPLVELGLDSILGMSLVQSIERELDMPIYVTEIMRCDTVNLMTAYLAAESGARSTVSAPGTDAIPEPKSESTLESNVESASDEPMVFVLSSPRAGSTLFRTMLQGHPELFAPPELHLLGYATLRDRENGLRGSGLDEGLAEALRTLRRCDAEAAIEELQSLSENNASVVDVYQLLQSLAAPRRLVDKSPTYGWNRTVLLQGARLFPNARYIHLVREPLAVMESIVRNRFHRLVAQQDGDPWKVAEAIWQQTNANVNSFLQDMDEQQKLVVSYEELVDDPERQMRHVCQFLGLTYCPEMLKPYAGDRMTEGLHGGSLSIGDPNFLKHHEIEPSRADEWMQALPDDLELGSETRALARRFGYVEPERLRLSPAQSQSLAHAGQESGWHVVQRYSFQDRASIDTDSIRDALIAIIDDNPQLRSLADEACVRLRPPLLASELIVTQELELTGKEGVDPSDALEAIEAELGGSLNVEHGPVIAVAVVRVGQNDHKVALVCHHLFVDGLSAVHLGKVLVAECCGSAESRKQVAEGSPYMDYLDAVERVDETELSAPAWITEEGYLSVERSIPLDRSEGENRHADQAEVSLDASRLVAADSMECARCGIFECLGAALARTMIIWNGSDRIVISLRLHGRDLGKQGVFPSAIGNFACDAPIRVQGNDLASALRSFGFEYAEVDRSGVGYELLRRCGEVPPPWDVAAIRFNYQPLGEPDASLEEISERNSDEGKRRYVMDFIARHHGERLLLICRYSTAHHDAATAERLLQKWRAFAFEILENEDMVHPAPLGRSERDAPAISST